MQRTKTDALDRHPVRFDHASEPHVVPGLRNKNGSRALEVVGILPSMPCADYEGNEMKPQLSIEAFADWCEKQPADATYPYNDVKNCAVSQYAKSLGVKVLLEYQSFWYRAEVFACKNPRTFGALAARLRAAS